MHLVEDEAAVESGHAVRPGQHLHCLVVLLPHEDVPHLGLWHGVPQTGALVAEVVARVRPAEAGEEQ